MRVLCGGRLGLGFGDRFLQFQRFFNQPWKIIAKDSPAIPAGPQGSPHFQVTPINGAANTIDLQSLATGALDNGDVFGPYWKVRVKWLP